MLVELCEQHYSSSNPPDEQGRRAQLSHNYHLALGQNHGKKRYEIRSLLRVCGQAKARY